MEKERTWKKGFLFLHKMPRESKRYKASVLFGSGGIMVTIIISLVVLLG